MMKDILRFAPIVTAAFAATYALPVFDTTSSTSSLLHVFLIFSFLLGFFINRALERRLTLRTAVNVELTRLRRLHHLTEQMSDAVWKETVQSGLRHYQTTVAKDLSGHSKLLTVFREFTHVIYDFRPADRREEILFQEMLSTSKEIALERPRIDQSLNGKQSFYSWLVLYTIAGFEIVLLLLNRGQQGLTDFSIGATITGVLITIDLLHQTDRVSRTELAEIEERYRKNIPKE
ncbi:hypothetical protein HY633_00635 [Candidatus Uhrbacteria bacterium]|nr:hypothetical protein [Candidatus Uhrbacteria bacterium]